MCEVTSDDCFFRLGRSRYGEHRDASGGSIMIPHPTLGWVTGVPSGLVEVHENIVLRLKFLTNVYSAAPLDIEDTSFGGLESPTFPSTEPSVKCMQFCIDQAMICKIQSAFPDFALCRNIPQLCNSLPAAPTAIDPVSLTRISPLAIFDISKHRFDAPAVSFGLGVPNPTTLRRRCAKEAVICHILRERAVLGAQCTWIGDRLFLRLRQPNSVDAIFYDWDNKERTLLTEAAASLASKFVAGDVASQSGCDDAKPDLRETINPVSGAYADDQEDVTDLKQQPHLGQFIELALTRLVTKKESQVVVFNGIAGSGKTFSARQCIDFALTLDAMLWEHKNPHLEIDQERRAIVDAALIILDAFGNIAMSEKESPLSFGDSTRLITLTKFYYNVDPHGRLKIKGAQFSNPFVFCNSILSSDLQNTFKVLLWLCSEDEISAQRLLGTEAALLTLGLSKEQLSSITSVLAAILVLRTPDIGPSDTGGSLCYQKSLGAPSADEGNYAQQKSFSTHETYPVRIPYSQASSFQGQAADMFQLTDGTRSSARRYREETEAIEICADLLGINAEHLSAALSTVNDLSDDFQGALLPAPLTVAARRRTLARRACARYLYQALMKWLIDKINDALIYCYKSSKRNGRTDYEQNQMDEFPPMFLGYLDLPGFVNEITSFTSFETALINTTTDWLQNTLLRPLEINNIMQDATRRGLGNETIVLYGLTDVPELMFGFRSRTGILAALESFSICGREVRHDEFTTALDAAIGEAMKGEEDEEHFPNHTATIKLNDDEIACFTVVHLGGRVTYECTNWIDHNISGPPEAAINLIRRCENEILCDQAKASNSDAFEFHKLRSAVSNLGAFPTDSFLRSASGISKGFMRPMGEDLKSCLLALKTEIYSAELSTVLCLHAPKRHGVDGVELAKQLRASNAPELYRSLHENGRHSLPTHYFLERYKPLAPQLRRDSDDLSDFSPRRRAYFESGQAKQANALVKSLQCRYDCPELDELVIGQSQVFGQRHAYRKLETLLSRSYSMLESAVRPKKGLTVSFQPDNDRTMSMKLDDHGARGTSFGGFNSAACRSAPLWTSKRIRVLRDAERIVQDRFIKLSTLKDVLTRAYEEQLSNPLIHYLSYLYRVAKLEGFPTSFVENTEKSAADFQNLHSTNADVVSTCPPDSPSQALSRNCDSPSHLDSPPFATRSLTEALLISYSDEGKALWFEDTTETSTTHRSEHTSQEPTVYGWDSVDATASHRTETERTSVSSYLNPGEVILYEEAQSPTNNKIFSSAALPSLPKCQNISSGLSRIFSRSSTVSPGDFNETHMF